VDNQGTLRASAQKLLPPEDATPVVQIIEKCKFTERV